MLSRLRSPDSLEIPIKCTSVQGSQSPILGEFKVLGLVRAFWTLSIGSSVISWEGVKHAHLSDKLDTCSILHFPQPVSE
jgi:hypothetical protein